MIIPESVLKSGYKGLVHVENWNNGCAFHYTKTVNGVHFLITPRTRKEYKTKNNLLYTKKNLPIST